jgi:hypothetical protein
MLGLAVLGFKNPPCSALVLAGMMPSNKPGSEVVKVNILKCSKHTLAKS